MKLRSMNCLTDFRIILNRLLANHPVFISTFTYLTKCYLVPGNSGPSTLLLRISPLEFAQDSCFVDQLSQLLLKHLLFSFDGFVSKFHLFISVISQPPQFCLKKNLFSQFSVSKSAQRKIKFFKCSFSTSVPQ